MRWLPLRFCLSMALHSVSAATEPALNNGLIDDFSSDDGVSRLGTPWRLVTDQVMGGVSQGQVRTAILDGRRSLCLEGDVSLANGGGFIQVALDLAQAGTLDAHRFSGIRLLVRGNGEAYTLHLKTNATALPWQAYRAHFDTAPEWRELRRPFDTFAPYRVTAALDPARLVRLGILAIGRPIRAEVCVAEIGFY
jgi:hypothetical protein